MTLADIFQRFVEKPSKRMYTVPNDKDHVSKKWRTAFLTVGTVYLKHTTQNPLSNAASDNQRSPNMTLHLNKKHVFFQIEKSQEVLKTIFVVTTKENSRAELKQTILERTQRRFGKFVFSFRWNRPIFFERFVRKSSKQLHTVQIDEDHISKKIKSCFNKYSISQHISNAGCKEPKYQTQPSKSGLVETWLCIWTKNTYCSK